MDSLYVPLARSVCVCENIFHLMLLEHFYARFYFPIVGCQLETKIISSVKAQVNVGEREEERKENFHGNRSEKAISRFFYYLAEFFSSFSFVYGMKFSFKSWKNGENACRQQSNVHSFSLNFFVLHIITRREKCEEKTFISDVMWQILFCVSTLTGCSHLAHDFV